MSFAASYLGPPWSSIAEERAISDRDEANARERTREYENEQGPPIRVERAPVTPEEAERQRREAVARVREATAWFCEHSTGYSD